MIWRSSGARIRFALGGSEIIAGGVIPQLSTLPACVLGLETADLVADEDASRVGRSGSDYARGSPGNSPCSDAATGREAPHGRGY